MKVVVSGAKGFIGSNLLNALKGEFNFVALDVEEICKPEVVEFSFQQADVLIHLAGLSSIADCEKDVYKAYTVNVALTGYLVDTFYKINPKGRVIFASSGHVYDSNTPLPLTKESPINPTSTYSRTKLSAEGVVKELTTAYKAKLTILRFFNTTHKSQRPVAFLPSVFQQIKNSNDDVVKLNVGNIDIERDFSSIQDIIRVLRYCLHKNPSESIQLENVSSGVPKSLRQIVMAMANKMNKAVEINVEAARVREGEAKSHYGDSIFQSLGLMTDGKSVDAFVNAFLSDL